MKSFFTKFNVRKLILALADCFIVATAALMSNFVLTLWNYPLSRSRMMVSIAFSVCCCFGGLFVFGAYHKYWRFFSWKDYLSCIKGVCIGMTCSCILAAVAGYSAPLLYVVLHGLISVIGICLFRFMFKETFITLINTGKTESTCKRTMIIGGGQACELILTEIENAKMSVNHTVQIAPVCIVDDDFTRIGQCIGEVPIVGTTQDIPKFVEQEKIEQILFAIPSCQDEKRKQILDICSSTKVAIKIVPFLSNLLFGNEGKEKNLLNQIRDIRIEDLLGRVPIHFDCKGIKSFITDKVCMVTGGGGSIGSELVRQIFKYNPKHVIIVDIYENNAYEIQQELQMEYGSKINLTVLIASVRDYNRMSSIFEAYHPQIVFHAAAHKHVPLMEYSPMEAIKNNVIGTFHMATLADYFNVQKFVMISTDKAVNPTNAMGASKRCCEMIMQYMSQQGSKTEFVTTRFGNVLGSNGSVIPLFKRQIEQGKPVTVTHPDIIRYFMTIPEAVSLVLEAAAMAHGGEIFVLDMGKPVRILTLAENMIRMYGRIPYKDVEIQFTGLRPGEKIKEELLMHEEGLTKTSNHLIFIGKQIKIQESVFMKNLIALKNAAAKNDVDAAVAALHQMVPTFVTPEEFNCTSLVAI